MANPVHRIEKPFYPIVYVRGYAMTENERENVFHDAYYGFSATSVEKRNAPPPQYFEVDIFEGQFIRLMKMKRYGYADAVNRGLRDFYDNPTRSIFISRFYDRDYLLGTVRDIEDHATELFHLITGNKPEDIRPRLKAAGADFGEDDEEFKVILVAHSMGGLVCRTLIQNVMPKHGLDPRGWIHRLVTIGSPHRGIELGRVPNVIERVVAKKLNPFNSAIFDPENMRKYLKLDKKYDVHSLGTSKFPVKRCFCIIGSDYGSYGATQFITGGFSDGLVKQDRAYVVAGTRPDEGERYPQERVSFGANVHRAHSGNRGIVNSYESYENLQRFLFGNIRADISLRGCLVAVPDDEDARYFYDVEFLATIRLTGVYLQRREQDPCENAIRYTGEQLRTPTDVFLYTAFLRSSEKDDPERKFSEFALTIRMIEHRVKKGLAWDHEYPGRQIYDETLVVRVGDTDGVPGEEVDVMWLSDRGPWIRVNPDSKGVYEVPLRAAGTLQGAILIATSVWPDDAVTEDSFVSKKR